VLQKEDERYRERFAASRTFLRDFERRQSLFLRTPHHEQRSALDERDVDYFLMRLNSLSNDVLPELIFNVDETGWRLCEVPRKVLAKKGSDTVKLEWTTGEKTPCTALGARSCASHKLPLWVLAKEWTVQCERKFGHHPMVILRHLESEWATKNVIAEFIESLHREIADYMPCILIMEFAPVTGLNVFWTQQRQRTSTSVFCRSVELVRSSRWTAESSAS
jgi:hypothetical protein